MRRFRTVICWSAVLLVTWLRPTPALAYISHWDPLESFFIRQFAYLAFALAMLFFAYELKLENLHEHPGFRKLIWASVFFALWNLNCFVGQLLSLGIDSHMVGMSGGRGELELSGWGARIYYVTKLDHLLLVPAFFFLYMGIRAFRRRPEVNSP